MLRSEAVSERISWSPRDVGEGVEGYSCHGLQVPTQPLKGVNLSMEEEGLRGPRFIEV
jgi:hypothetical protein